MTTPASAQSAGTPDDSTAGSNPVDALLAHAAADPTAIAVRGPRGEDRVELTRAGLATAIARAADRFAAAGLRAGDRIVLIAPTCPEFLAEFFGAQTLGIAVVAVNPLSTEREISYLLADSGARLVLAHPACADAGRAAAEDADIRFEDISLINGDPAPAAVPRPVRRRGDDLAALLYTSGTTGRPKGAMLAVGNLLAVAEVGRQISAMGPDDRSGTALPLFHVFGLASVAAVALSAGVPLTLLPRFDARELFDTIIDDRLTVVAGVPTMWNAILQVESDRTPDTLRLALSGGASIAVELMRRFESRFGAQIAEGYGLTETTAFGTFNPWDGRIVPGSVGLPVPQLEVRVVGPHGAECEVDEVGEVCIRGAMVMRGYWNNPEATARAFDEDGFFRTGDLGRIDADGYLFIVDRIKDLIIHGGYNVYPREVEEVLYEHPHVLEAAVVGTPDEHYGQTVTAVITPLPGTALTAEEIEAFCRERLAAYKIPRIIRFVEALPKGSTGKIRKRDIPL